MPQPVNQRSAAVIEPILSHHARGYRNLNFIAQVLMPRVSIPNRSMRTLRFGKESFRRVNTRRAPGGQVARIQYGYADDPVSLVQDALEALVPIEHQQEAASVPGVNLASAAVDMVMEVMDLGLEQDCAALIRNADNYDANHKLALAGPERWTDPGSDPKSDIDEARESVRRSIGRYPNTLSLGPDAFTGLSNHPKIKDQFKYTSSQSITTEMLAGLFNVENVVVGSAVYLPETADDDQMASDVWGDDAILAYVPKGDNFRVPSFGYTYELDGYPMVEQPYYSNEVKSWIYPTTIERRPLLVGAEGGFLFQGAGAPA